MVRYTWQEAVEKCRKFANEARQARDHEAEKSAYHMIGKILESDWEYVRLEFPEILW